MAFVGTHKGTRQYTGDETGNVVLGQAGFDVLPAGEYEAGTTAGYENVKFWVGIKAVNHATNASSVEARGVNGGDLTRDGAAYDGISALELAAGDIIYGAFDKIKVGTLDTVLAYRG